MPKSHEEISKELPPIYNGTLISLNELELKLNGYMRSFEKDHLDWLAGSDFRPGCISRILSNVVSIKFLCQQTLDYFKKEGWPDNYREKFMTEIFKQRDHFGHVRDIDTTIRFALLQMVYSQVEATHRVIHRTMGLDRGKPIDKVNEITGTYSEEIIKLFDYLRNTIHNNGVYRPLGRQERNWTWEFRDKEYVFVEGSGVNVTTGDLIGIIDEHIDLLYATITHKEIMKLPLTVDAI